MAQYRQTEFLWKKARKSPVKMLPSVLAVSFAVAFLSLGRAPAQTPTDASARTAVLDMLQRAPSLQVQLTKDEILRIAQAEFPNPSLKAREKIIEREVKNCNNNGYQERQAGMLLATAGTVCDSLGESIAPDPASGFKDEVLGAGSPQAEIALARACSLPLVQGVMGGGLGCWHLSLLYQRRGSLTMALAVVQSASKCQGTLSAEASVHAIDPDRPPDYAHEQLRNCLVQEAMLLHKLHRRDEERAVDVNLCNAADEVGCYFLAGLGQSVNMDAVRRRQAELQAADSARASADEDADRRAQAEHDAHVNQVLQTLHSLPGGNNPNAIVDTANQQATNMVALGAANDAARAQSRAAQQRTAAAQAQAAVQVQVPSGTSDARSTTANSSATQSSSTDSSGVSTYTYVQPATDCLSYAVDQNTKGILVTNNCKDEVVLTWARPAGTHVGLDYAIQGGADIVPGGGTDSIPPNPVRVFACHAPGTPTKPGHENSSNGWMPEYTDTSFTCPALNHAAKKR